MFNAEETQEGEISIRMSRPGDGPALRRLAERDSSPVPVAPVLIASVNGELRAAVSLAGTGQAVADPFYPTERLLALLRVEAGNRGVRKGYHPVAGALARLRSRNVLRGAPAWR
jgi:hypothetical protein